jgi:hypothetical protein
LHAEFKKNTNCCFLFEHELHELFESFSFHLEGISIYSLD